MKCISSMDAKLFIFLRLFFGFPCELHLPFSCCSLYWKLHDSHDVHMYAQAVPAPLYHSIPYVTHGGKARRHVKVHLTNIKKLHTFALCACVYVLVPRQSSHIDQRKISVMTLTAGATYSISVKGSELTGLILSRRWADYWEKSILTTFRHICLATNLFVSCLSCCFFSPRLTFTGVIGILITGLIWRVFML